jgi:hypothetical protein
MVTEDRGTFKSFAKNSMQASLARPSMGAEVIESLSAPPNSPVMAFFLALNRNVTPLLDSRMGITHFSPRRTPSRPAVGLPPAVLRVLQRARFSDACHQRDREYERGHVGSDAKQPQAFHPTNIANAQYIQHGRKQQSQSCPEDPDSAGIGSRHE